MAERPCREVTGTGSSWGCACAVTQPSHGCKYRILSAARSESQSPAATRAATIISKSIIYLLTGEDYIVVKKPGEPLLQSIRPLVLEGSCRSQSPHSLKHEKNNEKILELTNKIIHLLTGEVPRYEDATVCFSKKEWGCLDGHQIQNKDVSMDNYQPLQSMGDSVDKYTDNGYHNAFSVENCLTEGKVKMKTKRKCEPFKHMKSVKDREGESAFTAESSSDSDINTQTEHLSADVKSESASCEERTLTNIDTTTKQINTGTTSSHRKVESTTPEEGNLNDPNIDTSSSLVKAETISQEKEKLLDTDINTRTEHTQTEYLSIHIKEESFSSDEGNLIHSDQSEIEYKTVLIKEESDSYEEINLTDTDIYSPSKHTQDADTYAQISENLDCNTLWNSTNSDKTLLNSGKYCTATSSRASQQKHHTGEKQFSCPECLKCFTTNSSLIAHQRIHTGEKRFSCSECGKYFTAKSSLRAHERIHTGEKRFCCTVCGKRFTASSCLIAHKRIHTGEKPYACSICGRCFTTNSSLFTHQRTHTGEKPFSCSVCGKCFTTNSGLITHRRSHTGEKPFSCAECGKCFSKTSNLIAHKRLHTGEKPFSCAECGKSFISKAYLIIHEKIHMREKPFCCTTCGRSFSQKSALYRHQRIHANDNYLPHSEKTT
ncbi:oocyte zinc finger -like [Pelobates cultripes]|uniref:Oocyte zinc finger -like n=2 Tax=Pelobates cultripes TaxID=61616 RepID=A0AAD1TB19_PELCU|nr:oocyte zinc finger -like [Pelobates cultripes]